MQYKRMLHRLRLNHLIHLFGMMKWTGLVRVKRMKSAFGSSVLPNATFKLIFNFHVILGEYTRVINAYYIFL